MTYDEIDELLIEAQKLWPDWTATEGIERAWFLALGKFDYKLVEDGLYEYKTTKQGSYKEPKIFHVVETCRQKNVKKKHFQRGKPVDDAPTDPKAEEKAIGKIMAGADTAGKRWLIKRFEKEEKQAKKIYKQSNLNQPPETVKPMEEILKGIKF